MSAWGTLSGCRCLGVSFVLMPVWLECCGRPGRSAFAFSVADYQLSWPLLPPVNFLMPSHFESCRTPAAAVGLDRLLELPLKNWTWLLGLSAPHSKPYYICQKIPSNNSNSHCWLKLIKIFTCGNQVGFYQLDGDFEYLSRLSLRLRALISSVCDCGCASVAFLSYYLWIAAWYVVSSVMFSSHEFTAGIFRIKACSFCSFLLIICRLDN